MSYTLDDYLGTAPTDQIAAKVLDRVKKWDEFMVSSGMKKNIYANWSAHHLGPTALDAGSSLYEAFRLDGANDEVIKMRVGYMRTLVCHMLNLLFNRPPALRAVAANTEPESLEIVEGVDLMLKADFAKGGGHRTLRRAGEWSLLSGTAFLHPEWDIFAGKRFRPGGDDVELLDTHGSPILTERSRLEVVYDQSKPRWDDVEQCIVVDRANRYTLAAAFPDYREKILAVPPIHKHPWAFVVWPDEQTDDIPLLKYYHRPVNSRFLPDGRYVPCLPDGETVLFDEGNPYSTMLDGRLAIIPLSASQGLGKIDGHAMATDIMPPQLMINLVSSVLATMTAAQGAGNLAGPNIGLMSVTELVGGGRYFGVPPGMEKPSVLEMLPKNDFLMGVMNTMQGLADTMSGMRGLVKSEDMSNMSGVAIAQIKSLAIQFASSAQASVIEAYQDTGETFVRMRIKYGSAQQTVEVLGENNAVQRKIELTPESMAKAISRIMVEPVDPASQTDEGKNAEAQFMLQQGMFSTPQEYITARKTGRYEPLFRRDMSQLNLIHRENAMLSKGQEPVIMEADKHQWHDDEHAVLEDDPNIRQNPQLIAVIEEHRAKHKMFASGFTPMQGNDPQTGQPYPSAVEQLATAKANAQAQQQQMPQDQGQGAPQTGQAPAPNVGAQGGAQIPPQSMQPQD